MSTASLRVTRTSVRAGGQPVRVIAVRPDDDERRPLVLWVHGGGWQEGTPNPVEVAWWAVRGASVVTLGYRLSHAARWPRQLDDLRKGVLAGLATAGPVHPVALLAGSSAGAHLALQLACRGLSDGDGASPALRIGGCAALHPPADPLAADYPRARSAGSSWRRLLGQQPERAGELAGHASLTAAAELVSRPFPVLLVHGDADPIVPFSQSQLAASAFRAAGCDVALERLPGAGHEPDVPMAAVRDLMWAFLTSLQPASVR